MSHHNLQNVPNRLKHGWYETEKVTGAESKQMKQQESISI